MKKLVKIIFTICVLFSFSNINASVNTKERNESNNYGVNKKITITENNIDNIKRSKYVNENEKIYDFSNIISDEDEKELKANIDDFISKTNMDMVILTDNLPYTYDYENDDYAVDFYDYNDFGIDYKNYSGVILFRNTYEEDPFFNIYTTGDAQLYFTYERCESTLDDIYDYFVSKNYKDGIQIFINEFSDYYENGIVDEYKEAYIDESGNIIIPKHFHPPFLIAGIAGAVISGIFTGVMVSKNKMVYKAKEANHYLDRESIKYNRKESKLVSSHTSSHYNPPSSSSSSSGGSSGGGHSFSGSSGISHGGGGGRHG